MSSCAISGGGKGCIQTFITGTWTYWTKDFPTAWHGCSRNVFVFAIIVQMRHDQRNTMIDYWSTLDRYFTAFYGNT